MDKYNLQNKRLAELLGWRDIVEIRTGLGGVHPTIRHDHLEPVPDWCGSWEACGWLMVKYEIDVMYNWETVHTKWSVSDNVRERFDAHYDDKDMATRFAIVAAVIQKLEASK